MDDLSPPVLTSLLTATVARELAEPYGDQAVFPDRVVIDQPADADRLFPGWPASVLVIAYETKESAAGVYLLLQA